MARVAVEAISGLSQNQKLKTEWLSYLIICCSSSPGSYPLSSHHIELNEKLSKEFSLNHIQEKYSSIDAINRAAGYARVPGMGTTFRHTFSRCSLTAKNCSFPVQNVVEEIMLEKIALRCKMPPRKKSNLFRILRISQGRSKNSYFIFSLRPKFLYHRVCSFY